jgi:uncharacterized membrane protein
MILKGVNGCWEIIVGLLFLFFTKDAMYRVMVVASGYGVAASSHSAGRYLIGQANNFSVSTQYFIALYFLAYGAVNIFLAASLLKGRVWAYPWAIMLFIGFVAYQVYRLFLHYSGLLCCITIFDAILIIVTLLEYHRLKSLAATKEHNF